MLFTKRRHFIQIITIYKAKGAFLTERKIEIEGVEDVTHVCLNNVTLQRTVRNILRYASEPLNS